MQATLISLLQATLGDDLKVMSEPQNAAYDACLMDHPSLTLRYRTAKTTPTKMGLFVTLWQRDPDGHSAPYHDHEHIDFYLIGCQQPQGQGCFVLPRAVLSAHGILSSTHHAGKRGFRVYPPWVNPQNKQALATQAWQSPYFMAFEPQTAALRQRQDLAQRLLTQP